MSERGDGADRAVGRPRPGHLVLLDAPQRRRTGAITAINDFCPAAQQQPARAMLRPARSMGIIGSRASGAPQKTADCHGRSAVCDSPLHDRGSGSRHRFFMDPLADVLRLRSVGPMASTHGCIRSPFRCSSTAAGRVSMYEAIRPATTSTTLSSDGRGRTVKSTSMESVEAAGGRMVLRLAIPACPPPSYFCRAPTRREDHASLRPVGGPAPL